MECFWILCRNIANRIQILVDAQTALTCEIQVLCGAHKGSRLSLDRRAQRAEVASSLWSEEEQSLLGMLGNGNNNAFFAYLPRPCFGFCEPVVRWRIGGSLKKCNDQQVVYGLVIGKRRVNPKPVAGLQIGYFGDWQSFARSRYVHLYPRPGKVE